MNSTQAPSRPVQQGKPLGESVLNYAPARTPRRHRRPSISRTLVIAILLLGSLAMLFPFWWMFVTSLASPEEASMSGGQLNLWPADVHLSNYPNALKKIGSVEWYGFLDALANTVVVTTLTVLGSVFSCGLVGYAFARMKFRGRSALFIVMIATMMLPMQITMIPMFIMFRSFGWIDTILPLVVPAFFGAPFFIFMFRQFFAQVPEALVEAARVDGCGHFRIWWQIMLPICKPVIAITAIFTFINAWNDFLGPLIYLQTEEKMTLAVALNSFQNQYGDFRDANYLMAASIVTMIPCIVLFFVAQKQFVSGLALGGVKG